MAKRLARAPIVAAALVAGLCMAFNSAYADSSEVLLHRVQNRLEMRSYQPYAGLQFGAPRTGPPQRGLQQTRPAVLMPAPVSPVIRPGRPAPYTAQWYSYCADKFTSFEPRTGLYTSNSGSKRICR